MTKTLVPLNVQTTGKRFRRENWRTSSLVAVGSLLRCEINMLRRLTSAAALAITLLTLARPLSAQNLVVNGGFETNTFLSGWTTGGTGICGNTGSLFHSGISAATSIGNCTLSQTFSTTPGQNYDFFFWLSGGDLNNGSGTNPRFFQAVWDGATVVTVNSSSLFAYTLYQVNNLAATGPTTTLAFTLNADPLALNLDDISVTLSQSTVPEPGSLTLLAAGIGALAAAGRLRKRGKA